MRSSPLTPRLARNVCSFRRSPTVSLNFVANVLLSAGASPAMVDNPEEAGLFAGIADAVPINLGTPTTAQVESMRLAAAAAQKAGKPWVLDPIARRTAVARASGG